MLQSAVDVPVYGARDIKCGETFYVILRVDLGAGVSELSQFMVAMWRYFNSWGVCLQTDKQCSDAISKQVQPQLVPCVDCFVIMIGEMRSKISDA